MILILAFIGLVVKSEQQFGDDVSREAQADSEESLTAAAVTDVKRDQTSEEEEDVERYFYIKKDFFL